MTPLANNASASIPSSALTFHPGRLFHLSPVFNTWCKLTARDVFNLSTLAGFGGQNIYFHLNHPIRYVRLVGLIVAFDEFESPVPRYSLCLDDGSGRAIELVYFRDPARNPAGMQPLDFGKLGVGLHSVVKAKGEVEEFRGARQVALRRIQVLTDTNAEVAAWEEMNAFKRDVLGKPWVVEVDEERRKKRKMVSSTGAEMKEEDGRGEESTVGEKVKKRRQEDGSEERIVKIKKERGVEREGSNDIANTDCLRRQKGTLRDTAESQSIRGQSRAESSAATYPIPALEAGPSKAFRGKRRDECSRQIERDKRIKGEEETKGRLKEEARLRLERERESILAREKEREQQRMLEAEVAKRRRVEEVEFAKERERERELEVEIMRRRRGEEKKRLREEIKELESQRGSRKWGGITEERFQAGLSQKPERNYASASSRSRPPLKDKNTIVIPPQSHHSQTRSAAAPPQVKPTTSSSTSAHYTHEPQVKFETDPVKDFEEWYANTSISIFSYNGEDSQVIQSPPTPPKMKIKAEGVKNGDSSSSSSIRPSRNIIIAPPPPTATTSRQKKQSLDSTSTAVTKSRNSKAPTSLPHRPPPSHPGAITTQPTEKPTPRSLKLLILHHIHSAPLTTFTISTLRLIPAVETYATKVAQATTPSTSSSSLSATTYKTYLSVLKTLVEDGNLIRVPAPPAPRIGNPNTAAAVSTTPPTYIAVGKWNIGPLILEIAREARARGEAYLRYVMKIERRRKKGVLEGYSGFSGDGDRGRVDKGENVGRVVVKEVWQRVQAKGGGWEGVTKGVVGDTVREVLEEEGGWRGVERGVWIWEGMGDEVG